MPSLIKIIYQTSIFGLVMHPGVVVVPWVSQLLGLPVRLGALLGAGTGICGVTAITAIAPVIAATEAEVRAWY